MGIAALYLLGPQLWPAVVIGDLLVNNYSSLPIGSAIGQSAGNLLEVLLAALLLRRFAARNKPLGSVRGLQGMLVALMAGTAVSATVGSIALLLGGVVHVSVVWSLWRTWSLGDLCGALIVVPLALAWIPWSHPHWPRRRLIELGALLAILAGVSTLDWAAGGGGASLSYLALPVLSWAALRFGPRGATLVIAVGSAFTLWATTHSLGSFAFHSVGHSVLETQLYLAISAGSTLALAVLVREREQLAERVRASRARLVLAADDERSRIERNIHDGAQQRLVALAANLGLATEQAKATPESAPSALASTQTELLTAIEELRELVHGIRPPALRRFGLATAVGLAAARSRMHVVLGDISDQRLDDSAEDTAYYVTLEALTNAERHARATIVHISARLAQGILELQIRDNGVGGATEVDALGLQGLRDRVEAVGGELTIESEPDRGTRIAASIPAVVEIP